MNGDPESQILIKVLDLAVLRQRVLSHNLANLDTPNFHRSDLKFTEELAQAVRRGPDAVTKLSVHPTVDETTPVRFDGNNVQLETELAEMSKNSLLYQMATQVLSTRMAAMRMAVTGRSS